MSAAADRMPAGRLRVLVCAADPARRDALRRLVGYAGHRSVDTLDEADVVLSDADQAGLLPTDVASQIDAALAAAAAGLTVRPAAQARAGFEAMQEHPLQTLLTPREMEVLVAIDEGLTNKMIARRLGISLHTVKFHVESLFRKLGVSTRTEALAKARERRLANTIDL
jgi:DNA-binding NarL/FixJ family response regulator